MLQLFVYLHYSKQLTVSLHSCCFIRVGWARQGQRRHKEETGRRRITRSAGDLLGVMPTSLVCSRPVSREVSIAPPCAAQQRRKGGMDGNGWGKVAMETESFTSRLHPLLHGVAPRQEAVT